MLDKEERFLISCNKYTNVNKNYEPIKEKTSLDFSAKIYLKNSGRGNKLQNHHVATEKNSSFTPKFKGIIEKYGLDLNDDWNIVKFPHSGRHPNDYHEWVLNGMQNIDGQLTKRKH